MRHLNLLLFNYVNIFSRAWIVLKEQMIFNGIWKFSVQKLFSRLHRRMNNIKIHVFYLKIKLHQYFYVVSINFRALFQYFTIKYHILFVCIIKLQLNYRFYLRTFLLKWLVQHFTKTATKNWPITLETSNKIICQYKYAPRFDLI